MKTIAKHTSYLLVNEGGELEIVHYAPDQDYSGRRDSDNYRCMQGLFINEPSHELWLSEVPCHRVVSAAWGLHTIEGLTCKIVAKKTYNWDMSKPMFSRQSDLKKSAKWDEYYALLKRDYLMRLHRGS